MQPSTAQPCPALPSPAQASPALPMSSQHPYILLGIPPSQGSFTSPAQPCPFLSLCQGSFTSPAQPCLAQHYLARPSPALPSPALSSKPLDIDISNTSSDNGADSQVSGPIWDLDDKAGQGRAGQGRAGKEEWLIKTLQS